MLIGGNSRNHRPTGETNGKSTNVDSLMDAVGASGVDLGVSLRVSVQLPFVKYADFSG